MGDNTGSNAFQSKIPKFSTRPITDTPEPDRSTETQQDHQIFKDKLKELLTKLQSCNFKSIEQRLDAIYLGESVWFLIFEIGIREIDFGIWTVDRFVFNGAREGIGFEG